MLTPYKIAYYLAVLDYRTEILELQMSARSDQIDAAVATVHAVREQLEAVKGNLDTKIAALQAAVDAGNTEDLQTHIDALTEEANALTAPAQALADDVAPAVADAPADSDPSAPSVGGGSVDPADSNPLVNADDPGVTVADPAAPTVVDPNVDLSETASVAPVEAAPTESSVSVNPDLPA